MANRELPKATVDAISATLSALLVPFAIPQEDISAGVKALLARIGGKNEPEREPLDRVITAKEAGELLHRSTKTVRELAKRGKIRAVKCGANELRASGYSLRSIRAFLAGKEAA